MRGFFMLKIEQYKLFYNSQDFEKIYKKSIFDLKKFFPDDKTFYNKYIKKAILDKKLFLFYKENFIIGYMFFSIKRKEAFWGFDFLEKKYRKYARIFRSNMLLKIAKEADALNFWIHKKNFSPLNSVKKIPKFLGIQIKENKDAQNILNNGKWFSLNLRELDNLKNCDNMSLYEIRTSLHFGAFAPEVARACVQDDDPRTIS